MRLCSGKQTIASLPIVWCVYQKKLEYGGNDTLDSVVSHSPLILVILLYARAHTHTHTQLIPFMGYTLRTPEYRFTEWTKWNGTTLTPDHTAKGLVGVELYRHDDSPTSPAWGLEYSFDHWENENLAAANPEVVKELTALLHSVQANETRIASFTPPFRG